MTEKRRKPERTTPKLHDLELSKETVQDLTEEQAEEAKGGLGPNTKIPTAYPCGLSYNTFCQR
jgi:hypothetical protein